MQRDMAYIDRFIWIPEIKEFAAQTILAEKKKRKKKKKKKNEIKSNRTPAASLLGPLINDPHL